LHAPRAQLRTGVMGAGICLLLASYAGGASRAAAPAAATAGRCIKVAVEFKLPAQSSGFESLSSLPGPSGRLLLALSFMGDANILPWRVECVPLVLVTGSRCQPAGDVRFRTALLAQSATPQGRLRH
jgi:hypothetical protein